MLLGIFESESVYALSLVALVLKSSRNRFLFSLKTSFYLSLGSCFLCTVAVAEELGFHDRTEQLFRDLELVRLIDEEIHDKLPVLYNYQGLGGYFTMPSARMPESGMVGFGYSALSPYNVWNLSVQFFDHVETVGTYWIYKGITEGNFGHLGFGDDADRSANLKLSLLKREDGFPFLPDLSLGWVDFLGTGRFNSFFAVATKEFLRLNCEATLGWGSGRIQGFFGGIAWTPWRRASHFLKGLTLAAEYDAINYKKHPQEHPGGRTVHSRVNAGAHYRFGNYLQASASSIRGVDWAASVSMHYPLGETRGLFPKLYDPPMYQGPVDIEPIGRLRSGEETARDLAYAFKEQGFDLTQAYLVPSREGKDALWLKVANLRYRNEEVIRERVEQVLSLLSPSNLSHVTTVLEAEGVEIQEYRFRTLELERYREGFLGENEWNVISPPQEAGSKPDCRDGALVYRRKKPLWILTFRPRIYSYFGSSTGKYKGQFGFAMGPEGYLFDDLYYCVEATLTFFSMLQNINSWDVLNPSRIINVRTDNILYQKAHSFHIEKAFMQRSWNLGQGWFTRFAGGYFEMAYGGLAWEALYYPVQFHWAIGFEAAVVWKRRYYGMGFYNKIRKLTPEGVIWVPYTGLQYFVDFYYDYKPLNIDFKVSVGQFLARDKGVRFDGGRTFSSGLRVGLWYTFTNANDIINGSRYYDKGFSITMPLDLFMNQTSRTRVGYGMSAWLRDCGAKAFTGKELHPTIYNERYTQNPIFY